jgi:hypothetical protein
MGRIIRVIRVPPRPRPAWWRGWFRPGDTGGLWVPACKCRSERDAYRVLAAYPPGQWLVLPAGARDPNEV